MSLPSLTAVERWARRSTGRLLLAGGFGLYGGALLVLKLAQLSSGTRLAHPRPRLYTITPVHPSPLLGPVAGGVMLTVALVLLIAGAMLTLKGRHRERLLLVVYCLYFLTTVNSFWSPHTLPLLAATATAASVSYAVLTSLVRRWSAASVPQPRRASIHMAPRRPQ